MKINTEELITRLKGLQQSEDTETAHIQADWIICNLLEDLGYKDIVKEYDAIMKWYA